MRLTVRRLVMGVAVSAATCGLLLLCVSRGKPVQDTHQHLIEAEIENIQRIRRIEEVCYKHNLGLYKHTDDPPKLIHPPAPQYGVFYIDRKHNISWCPLYKAASTTWLYHLSLLAGYSEEQIVKSHRQLSEIAREAYPELDYEDAEKAFLTTLKLLVVRHPFSRILSAYRDKLENMQIGAEHGTKHYYLRYGRQIVARYRHGGNSTKTMRLLKPGQYMRDAALPEPVGIEPTFEEFVRYLLDTDLSQWADDHWIPYYLYCTPCLLKYDVVAKVETLVRDQEFALRRAGLWGLVKPQWRHRAAVGGGAEAERRYFSQLTKAQVERLYEKYWLDFELFDYSPEKYVSYARSQ
ncbi:carbohydrate sulfotransferase 8-like isoform X1 [Schistocerca nitens]|uniref:carbohydrate sulfotransferase 8-like isoform X1 n=1 Tax=Schistocerca nitens TaxID=7011 RepID=UPI00211791CC|nr:carbohydrate sulfotransferase 8-like isoform X1 [Schistocerca nitens]